MKFEIQSKKRLAVLVILLSTFYFLFSISLVSAAGLVPCGQGPTTLENGTPNPAFKACTFCDFFVLIQNIIKFILAIFASLATLMAIYIAFLFMFSGGSPQKISDAKSKLWLLVIGIFWVLGSWLVLNTIINFVARPGVFPLPWNKINCSVSQSTSQPSGISGSTPTGGSPSNFQPGGGQFGGGGASATLGQTLTEQQARNELQQDGITINKNPCPTGVSYQNVSGGCTSLNGIETSAIAETIQLKKDCNCAIKITGGTELGHAAGTISHASGDKLDFQPNSTLDQYIQNNFSYIGLRSDSAKQYQASNGMIMAREGDHWDVTFTQ
ncbi:MAG: pilin [Candidatus Azambacteria bacterium]|nr:pilin [Candidatus Azambacteria bacterium]